MTTAAHAIDGTPTALTGLADGTEYTLQNVGGRKILVAEADAAPGANDYAFVVEPGGHIWATPDAGSSVWVWCVQGESVLVTSEAE